jgi:hypothetical protein
MKSPRQDVPASIVTSVRVVQYNSGSAGCHCCCLLLLLLLLQMGCCLVHSPINLLCCTGTRNGLVIAVECAVAAVAAPAAAAVSSAAVLDVLLAG